MSQQTTGSLSTNFLKRNLPPRAVDQVYRSTDLFNAFQSLGLVVPSHGSSPIDVNLITTANSTAAVFVEGATFSTVGSQGVSNRALPVFYVGTVAGYSGMVRDSNDNNGYYEDIAQLETLVAGGADTLKKFEDTLCGSTVNQGISAIIDDTQVYGGIDPSSNTWWKSGIQNASGSSASVVYHMEEATETMLASPNVSNLSHWLMPANQVTNYMRSAGVSATTPLFRVFNPLQTPNPSAPVDLGLLNNGLSFNGQPIIKVAGLTTTEVYGIDRDHIKIVIHKPLTVRQLASSNYDDSFLVVIAGCLDVDRRKAHVKIKALSA